MKSAYELAMERLEQNQPSVSLTDDQKQQLAELDNHYKAKIAEKEVFLREQIQNAGDQGEIEQLEKQLASERARLEEQLEAEKDTIRKQDAGRSETRDQAGADSARPGA